MKQHLNQDVRYRELYREVRHLAAPSKGGLMAEWKKVKLGDVAEITSSKRIFMADYVSSGVPFYRSREIIEKQKGNEISTELFITEDKYNEIKSKFSAPEKGDVLLTSVGTLGVPYVVKENEKFYFKDGNLTWLKNFIHLIPEFLYYYFISNSGKAALEAISIGTTQKAITIVGLKSLEIPLPPLATQKKIARVLGALDDKIELNNQMNYNLEEQAKALFKSWFVDFEPFGGKMPEEWREGTLKDLIEIRYGKDHKKLADGQIPVYGSGGLMRYAEKALYQGESVLIPRKGTLNNVMRVSGAFWTVDTMFYSIPKKKGAIKYAYHILSVLDLATMNSGSAVPSMTTEILNSLKVILPTEQVLLAFDDLTEKFWETHELNRKENQQLAQLRDTLLPKLMSGEIDVSEVEV